MFGGKFTTKRKPAEAAPHFAGIIGPHWTASALLPGGEAITSVEDPAIQLMARLRQLDPELAQCWSSTYGSRIWSLMDSARNLSELGRDLSAGLSAREVECLVFEQWTRDADDILWRRTKLSLFLNSRQRERLEQFLGSDSSLEPCTQFA